MQDRYKEHVKQTMGKKQPKNSSLTIEKLNELLFAGEISERIYEMVRRDIENHIKTGPDNNMVSSSNPLESCSNPMVSYN